MGIGAYGSGLGFPGITIPDLKWNSTFYNPGKIEETFISKCASLFSMAKSDTQEQVKSKTKMTDEQFIQVFGDVPENISFDAIDKIPAGIDALNGINLVLTEVMSNGNNLDIYKNNGYSDSLAIFVLIDSLEFPKLDQEKVRPQLKQVCDQLLEAINAQDLSQEALRDIQAQLNGLLGSLLEKIDPQRAKILAKEQPTADELKDLVKYIQDDFIDDVVKITDKALTQEEKKAIDVIESKLKIKAVNPGVAIACTNTICRSMSSNLQKKEEMDARRAWEIEIDGKRAEKESAAKRRNETKRAEKKRSKNNVASK